MDKNWTQGLLDWYQANGRDLPWRSSDDGYAKLVAEFMLQQTRVQTVIPYYQRWMARFPTFAVLAAAGIDELLVLWEGLGYYRRAHNLHKAVQGIVSRFGGEIPADTDDLRSLPGIGPYTLAAIQAMIHHQDVLALDGNLRRVLARFYNLEMDPRGAKAQVWLRERVMTVFPAGQASDFNQALMDLGAMICLPRRPRCLDCPLAASCEAHILGLQYERPLLPAKKSIPHYQVTAGILQRNGTYLLARRPEDKMLAGLWEFPGGKQEPDETLQACLQRELAEELGVDVQVGAQLGTFKHAYSHFRVTLHAFYCNDMQGEPCNYEHDTLAWVPAAAMGDYAMGKIDRLIASRLFELDTV